MKVKDFTIKFKHERLGTGGTTFCELETPDTIVVSEATCSKKDMFCKDTGRKVALHRAMDMVGLNKQSRADIWEAYRNLTPTPRW